ncbi:ChbG/HpnK family deacetylase [Candidatus Parvarchaeota archaeon]|nr:ChbG/HpnK family deacetylase [Candidatus Parvarchaeota archaeon]
MIKLILNADDFGHSKIFNTEIIKLLREGKLKSTTVMVKRVDPTQKYQIEELGILRKDGISIGIHFEIDENEDIRKQIEEQYSLFFNIFGFEPSHFDIHMPKYRLMENAALEIIKFGDEKAVPVRNLGLNETGKHTSEKAFFATNHSIEEIYSYIDDMQEGKSYEIIVHPGMFDPESKSSLNKDREQDILKVNLINKKIKQRPEIKIISYLDL